MMFIWTQPARSPGRSPAGVACLISILLTAGLCSVAFGQDGDPVAPEAVDEITVYGEKNLVLLRVDFEMAKETFFEVFNEINGDPRLDVECESIANLGSYRKHHQCMPRYMRKLIEEATQDMIMGGDWSDYRIDHRRRKGLDSVMREKITELLSTHPEIQDAANDLTRTKSAFEAEQERRRTSRDR